MELMLAEVASAVVKNRWDISGSLCLTLIPIMILIIFIFAKAGPLGGSGICLIIGVICLLCIGEIYDAGEGSHNKGDSFITNDSRTKWMPKNLANISDPDCLFHYTGSSTTTSLDDKGRFIPAGEMISIDGIKHMKDGSEIDLDDYYNYDEEISKVNIPVVSGGDGVPQWLYHPAVLIYPFMICGIPALMIGIFISNRT